MKALVELVLAEDIGSGDVTTEAIFGDTTSEGIATIRAKQDLILSGTDVTQQVFETVDSKLQWHCDHLEGAKIKAGALIATVSGAVSSLLTAERTALNFLQQLSGIATWTARFVEQVRETGVVLRDTRKTIPGLRQLSKQAVRAGGAENHRLGLWDQFLVKDNHIAAAGSITIALEKVKKHNPKQLKIQIEVRNLPEAEEALRGGADSLLLDNMSFQEAANIAEQWRDQIELEVSGNVTFDNVGRWAETGVHAISIGALTHSAPVVDIAMTIEKN